MLAAHFPRYMRRLFKDNDVAGQRRRRYGPLFGHSWLGQIVSLMVFNSTLRQFEMHNQIVGMAVHVLNSRGCYEIRWLPFDISLISRCEREQTYSPEVTTVNKIGNSTIETQSITF